MDFTCRNFRIVYLIRVAQMHQTNAKLISVRLNSKIGSIDFQSDFLSLPIFFTTLRINNDILCNSNFKSRANSNNKEQYFSFNELNEDWFVGVCWC